LRFPSGLYGTRLATAAWFQTQGSVISQWLAVGIPGVCVQVSVSNLDDVFELLPLSPILDRYLVIEFGAWCCLLTNGPLGSDVGVLPLQAASAFDILALRATTATDGPYPATVLEVFQGSECLRSLTAAKDGLRWRYFEYGTPLPVEDSAAASSRLVRNRFTPKLLNSYLDFFGVPSSGLSGSHKVFLVTVQSSVE
jgi:hypothetical protein